MSVISWIDPAQERILIVLGRGPLTRAQIAEKTELTEDAVDDALRTLRHLDFVRYIERGENQPMQYDIVMVPREAR